MSGDTRHYDFKARWLRSAGTVAGFLVVPVALHVTGWLDHLLGFSPGAWLFIIAVVALPGGWIIARNLVLSASFDGRVLRARTLLRRHDIDLADITAIDWTVDQSTVSGSNVFSGDTVRVRYRGGTLRIVMPAGAGLVRDLEEAGPGRAGSQGSGSGAREFDFTAFMTTGFGVPDTTIKHAVLGVGELRATTVDGGEHAVRLDEIDEVDHGGRSPGGAVLLRYPGGTLHIPQPAGAELADRLSASVGRR